MAGNYPDAPAPRLAYDRDGTVAFHFRPDRALGQLPQSQLTSLNGTAIYGHQHQPTTWAATEVSITYGVLFPSLRSVTHAFITVNTFFGNPNINEVQVTTNSTNGIDGTWTTVATNFAALEVLNPSPAYRTPTAIPGASSIKGIRFAVYQGTGNAHWVQHCHLYGKISAGDLPNRVRLWHPTLDAPLEDTPAFLDWGDVQRSSTADRTFRVKNNSASLTANDIVVSTEIITDAVPSVPPQFTYSMSGSAYAASLVIASVLPGALSPVISIRRTTPVDAALSVWTPRTVVAPGSMT